MFFLISLASSGISCPVPHIPLAESRYQSDHLSISRTLCGALVFPTIANLVGRVTFRRVNSSLQRTILVSGETGDRNSGVNWVQYLGQNSSI